MNFVQSPDNISPLIVFEPLISTPLTNGFKSLSEGRKSYPVCTDQLACTCSFRKIRILVTRLKTICATGLLPLFLLLLFSDDATGQSPETLMPIEFENSAEFRWFNKKVLDSRPIDDLAEPDKWNLEGTGRLTFPGEKGPGGLNILRVDMEMFTDEPAPTPRGLSAVNLNLEFEGDDWRNYNRISVWIRPDIKGFPILPIRINLHNDGEEKLPDNFYREGSHYVTLQNGNWQQVVWEIDHLARDNVTALEFGYWVNKMLADPDDRVAFEITKPKLQRVQPDHYKGWKVAPGGISYSHTGYQSGSSKTAFSSDLDVEEFLLVRLDPNALPVVVLRKPVEYVSTRLGEYQLMDFSEVQKPGRYIIRAGDRHTRPFRIDENVWRGTVWKALNFFFGQRCGYEVPGSHDVCHLDWLATHGDKKIVMNGGWHDAGDLSQGLVNTGEATYSMFALAKKIQERDKDPELLEAVIREAKWGLEWVLRVRFDGGYRIGFASNNLWTTGIIGDADDRSQEALNNPNVNYIAAAAGAIAYQVLKDRDPELAARSLRIAKDDWSHAITGIEGPETWHTPAFAATELELAGIGVLASMELFEATGEKKYADKAIELGQVIVRSQQKSFVGPKFPLAGFFYTGPDKEDHFHQFHHANDQDPIVALAKLVDAFPDHEDWMDWYSTVVLYSEYQKRSARITEPYRVLPAYVYHETDYIHFPEQAARHQASRGGFREQVMQGMYMGDGYYLRAFPVWFARRGNYGVLLAQAKALATASHVRRDGKAAELAQKQAQWIVGRNPFAQSTMYGEGYDWKQQYSVSSGDFVGSLPVGMQSWRKTDLPYWPPQNMFVYTEVWVHSTSRWLWLMEDISGPVLVKGRVAPGASRKIEFTDNNTGYIIETEAGTDGLFRIFLSQGRYSVHSGNQHVSLTALPGSVHHLDLRPGYALDTTLKAETDENGRVTIQLTASGEGTHSFEIRSENLDINQPVKDLTLQPGSPGTVEWSAKILSTEAPWVAVVIPNGNVQNRLDITGSIIK